MVPVQPGDVVPRPALILHLTALAGLAPAALVLLAKTEAHSAVVRHHLAPVDQHVDVVRVVQRLALPPDHGKRGSDVRRPAQEVNVK